MNVDQFSGDFDYQILQFGICLGFWVRNEYGKFYQPNNYQYIYITEGGLTFNDNSKSNHLANRVTSSDELNAMYIKNRHDLEVFNEDDI